MFLRKEGSKGEREEKRKNRVNSNEWIILNEKISGSLNFFHTFVSMDGKNSSRIS